MLIPHLQNNDFDAFLYSVQLLEIETDIVQLVLGLEPLLWDRFVDFCSRLKKHYKLLLLVLEDETGMFRNILMRRLLLEKPSTIHDLDIYVESPVKDTVILLLQEEAVAAKWLTMVHNDFDLRWERDQRDPYQVAGIIQTCLVPEMFERWLFTKNRLTISKTVILQALLMNEISYDDRPKLLLWLDLRQPDNAQEEQWLWLLDQGFYDDADKVWATEQIDYRESELYV